MTDDRTEDRDIEGHAAEGMEHLQSAALELIAAARAFLDVAEDVVREPGVAATIVSAAAGVGRAVFTSGEHRTSRAETPSDVGRVRHIRVS